jgi:hypothetical protein
VKALPLWQPWASLVEVGAKRIETRHWPAPAALLGQRIAIHATKTPAHLAIGGTEPFRSALVNAYPQMVSGLPLGAIIATVVLDRCTQITADAADELERRNPAEYVFGNYEPGRFAWVLRDVVRLAEPVPFKGSQGIFDVPDELLGLPAPARHEQGALL